jgi:NAD(P)H dehydrogenase (quinone)
VRRGRFNPHGLNRFVGIDGKCYPAGSKTLGHDCTREGCFPLRHEHYNNIACASFAHDVARVDRHGATMKIKIGVVGGTGMIGAAITGRLVGEGHDVVAVARTARSVPAGAVFRVGDVERPETLRAALHDREAVVMVLPLSPDEPGGFVPERDGTANVLAILPSRSVRIVKISEIGAGQDPRFFDLEAKAYAERAIVASGHPYVLLRPTWVMEAWREQLRAGESLLAIGPGTRRIHWVALEDLARWTSQALASEAAVGRKFTLQGRDALGFLEAARQLSEVTGLAVIELAVEAVRPPGMSPAMLRTLHQLFTYYARPEEFEAEEAWRILGEPQLRWADFVAGYAR